MAFEDGGAGKYVIYHRLSGLSLESNHHLRTDMSR